MGYSRQQFYEIRRNFQTYGADGLIDRLPGAKGPHPNRVPEDGEKAILDHALEHPSQGPLRVAQENWPLTASRYPQAGCAASEPSQPADQA